MLGQFGSVDALEVDDVARAMAEKRLGHKVLSAPLPELAGVADDRYDLVAALDVIEHIPDDKAALEGIARVLKPGGKLLATVPAHQWMWSAHDVVNHHQRRYSKAAFRKLIDQSPLKLESIGYFNSLLFPVALAERLASKVTGQRGCEPRTPARAAQSGAGAGVCSGAALDRPGSACRSGFRSSRSLRRHSRGVPVRASAPAISWTT